jgi:hypothetical protein
MSDTISTVSSSENIGKKAATGWTRFDKTLP